MKRECCNQNCRQGDTCPLRLARIEGDQKGRRTAAEARRKGPSVARWLFGWLLKERRVGALERRSGADRRTHRNQPGRKEG